MIFIDLRFCFQVIDLEKKIAELDAKIKESQQFWLRLQSTVVALSEKRAQQLDEAYVGRKREYQKFREHLAQLNIYFIRTDGD